MKIHPNFAFLYSATGDTDDHPSGVREP